MTASPGTRLLTPVDSSIRHRDGMEDGTRDAGELMPARMLNEYSYCPRLFYLEHVERQWMDNEFTLDGKRVHRRVDVPSQAGLQLDDATRQHARSVRLGDPELGLIAAIDIVEAEGMSATPIDYKRSKKPAVPEGAYEPERVQLCVQALLLRAHGFETTHGVIYFAGSRERVEIKIDVRLVKRTHELLEQARALSLERTAPPPLVDSPKCGGCSLAPICLPDEQNQLLGRSTSLPRAVNPPRDDALPVHVGEHGSVVSKSGGELIIKRKGTEVGRARLIDVSRLSVHGDARVTQPALRELIARGIPIAYYSYGGRYYGRTVGVGHKNVLLRIAQFQAALDPARSLALARRFVAAKIRNARVFLRRNHDALPKGVPADLKQAAEEAEAAGSLGTLLGVEGAAARLYFRYFGGLLRADVGEGFQFKGRNRRPPRDAVNALLSFASAMLTAEWSATLEAVGFDPLLGFLHQPRYGRPALALDLMEEFRPLVAESVVVNAINNGEVGPADFVESATAVALSQSGRKKFTRAFERRLEQEVTHPVFGYRISYRRTFDVQARLLGRYLQGELDRFPDFVTR